MVNVGDRVVVNEKYDDDYLVGRKGTVVEINRTLRGSIYDTAVDMDVLPGEPDSWVLHPAVFMVEELTPIQE